MKHVYCHFLFLFLGFQLLAQTSSDEIYPKGARSVGIGNANVTLADEWAVFNNIGALGRVDHNAIFVGFDQRFGLQELSTLALGTSFQLGSGYIGASVFRFGDDFFNQQAVGLGFSNTLGIVSFGVKVNYLQTNIEGFGRNGAAVLEFGGVAELSPKLFFGAHIYNLNQAKLSQMTEERLPSVVKTGISFRPNDRLMFNVEAQKEIENDPQVKIGLEYNFLEKLWLRTGINTGPANAAFGLSFTPKKFKIDYALGNNAQLGFTHHVSMSYLLSKQ